MRSQPINIIVYAPKTPAGKDALAKRVAEVHAEHVMRTIKNLTCPLQQKNALLDAVIDTVKQRDPPKARNSDEGR